MKCPKAIRRMVWLRYNGEIWKSKCNVSWCMNELDVLGTWHVGHNIPKSRGGTNNISNLRPICSDCNMGMGDRLTIVEWDTTYRPLRNDEIDAISALYFLSGCRNLREDKYVYILEDGKEKTKESKYY